MDKLQIRHFEIHELRYTLAIDSLAIKWYTLFSTCIWSRKVLHATHVTFKLGQS